MKQRTKQTLVLLLTFCLLLFCAASVCAENGLTVRQTPLLVDDADLLTDSEEAALNTILVAKSAAVAADIAVVTVNDTEGKSVQDFAQDFYDENGYGQGDANDGVLLLVSMAERDYWITTTGFCIEAITDYGREKIENDILSDLSVGNYAEAFRIFAVSSETLIAAARQGNVYDYYISDSDSSNGYGGYYVDASEYFGGQSYEPREEGGFNFGGNILLALVLGFILALITGASMKSSMKTVHHKYEAANYVVPGSLMLVQNQDRFLYSTVTQTPVPQHNDNNSSHGGGFSGGGSSVSIGSSGVPHGGGGGKF